MITPLNVKHPDKGNLLETEYIKRINVKEKEIKKTNAAERQREQKEDKDNAEIYLSWLNNDPDLFIKRLARKYNNRLAIVHAMTKIRRKDKELARDIKEWFKYPYHRNTVCNIYLILDRYYEIEEEHLLGFMSWLFETYEHKAWELWYNKYKERGFKIKYTNNQALKLLKAHGFKPMNKVKWDNKGNWVFSLKHKMIYPLPFNEQINSLDTLNPGIYLAGKLFGLPSYSGIYIGPQDGRYVLDSSKSNSKFIESNTI